MSGSGRATEFMRAWGEGHGKPHNPGCQAWGADPCDRCITEATPDPWEALVYAAVTAWPAMFERDATP